MIFQSHIQQRLLLSSQFSNCFTDFQPLALCFFAPVPLSTYEMWSRTTQENQPQTTSVSLSSIFWEKWISAWWGSQHLLSLSLLPHVNFLPQHLLRSIFVSLLTFYVFISPLYGDVLIDKSSLTFSLMALKTTAGYQVRFGPLFTLQFLG